MYENHRTLMSVLVCVLSFLSYSMLGCSGSDDNTTAPMQRANNVNLTIELEDPEQGLTQPGPGTHSVSSETPVEVLVSPRAGYVFSGWQLSGNGYLDDPDAPVTTVTLSGDALLTPRFKPEVRMTIQVSPPSCGSTVPMPEKVHSLGQGDTVELSASPGTGYYFVEWQVDDGCDIADPTASSTTAAVTGNCEVTAQFEEDLVKFSGIVTATAYTSMNSSEETTQAKLSWLEAVSPFSALPGEITYHVYYAESSDLETLYRPDHLVASLPGVLETEIEIGSDEKETYFLVVAEDPQGNRNRSRKVVSVVPCQMVLEGGAPMDLEEVGAEEITVSGAENIVTLHGGDWRYLFTYGQNIIVYGDGADLLKKVKSFRFDGRNTAIQYEDIQLSQVAESGHFRTSSTFPDLSELPSQTWQTVLGRADLPDFFMRDLESLDRSNSSVYLNPEGTMLVTESRADGVVSSRDGFQNTIPIGNFGSLHYLMDINLGVKDDIKWKNGEVEYFKVQMTGKVRIHGVAKIKLNSESGDRWEKKDLIQKKVLLIYALGPIPVVQEIEFWVDGALYVDINKQSNFEAEAGVKLEKPIDIGFEYRRDSGWKTIFNPEKKIDTPFGMSGSASTDTTLHLTPHFRTSFYQSATAEATLYSIDKLFADFTADNLDFYLTRFDVYAHAYMTMACDFSPFGYLLINHSDSLWLIDSQVYNLPELKVWDFLPETIHIDKDTEPHFLPAVVYCKFVDGINNGLRELWWSLEQLQPDGGMWVPVEDMQNIRLLLSDGLVYQAAVSKPPPYRFVFEQYTDLFVDRLLETGLYRIKVWGTTRGGLGFLDTRVAEARFHVLSEMD